MKLKTIFIVLAFLLLVCIDIRDAQYKELIKAELDLIQEDIKLQAAQQQVIDDQDQEIEQLKKQIPHYYIFNNEPPTTIPYILRRQSETD